MHLLRECKQLCPFFKRCATKNAHMFTMSSVETAGKKSTHRVNAQGSAVRVFTATKKEKVNTKMEIFVQWNYKSWSSSLTLLTCFISNFYYPYVEISKSLSRKRTVYLKFSTALGFGCFVLFTSCFYFVSFAFAFWVLALSWLVVWLF